mgnify:CR=1 FL=1
MTPIGTIPNLVVAAAIFTLGVIGALTRRNAVIVLLPLELPRQPAPLGLVSLTRSWGRHSQV